MNRRIWSAAAAMLALACPVRADDAQLVTFSRDVAPVFFEKCASCHRPGDIGPMSLLDYSSTRPWVKSIRKAVAEGTMPPWHADSTLVAYANDRSLSAGEKQAILKWIDQGAPEGNPKDLPKAPEFKPGWVMGEPDMIFHATTDFLIPANKNEIEYQAVIFDTSALTEDIYISAWEILPSELGVVHHANLGIAPKSFEGVASGNIIPHAALSGGDYIGSYLPGARPIVYPEGTAYRLPKGSSMAIQVHYVGKDHDIKNHLMFGVKYAKGRIDKLVRIVGLFGVDGGLNIPPGDPNYELVGNAKLLFDTLVLSSGVHMHLRGKDYTTEVVKPDGSTQLVTKVPKYDFSWQSNYWLKTPVFAPKGSSVRTTAHWDNSAKNPNNPDPTATVKNGPWTQDEMLNSWSHVVIADENLGMKIENGRLIEKYPDAQTKPHPRILQAIDLRKQNFDKDAEFFGQDALKVDPAAVKVQ